MRFQFDLFKQKKIKTKKRVKQDYFSKPDENVRITAFAMNPKLCEKKQF